MNQLRLPLLVSLIFIIAGWLQSCSSGNNGDLSVFSADSDAKIGLNLSDQISADTTIFLLSPETYPQQYAYLQTMMDSLLDTSLVVNNKNFEWTVSLIRDAELNAFIIPGGYLYINTGLIKFLDDADQLAGMIGHEVAHADRQHTFKLLLQVFSISDLQNVSNGKDASAAAKMIKFLSGKGVDKSYSPDTEQEADSYAVQYLAKSPYACDAITPFFKRMKDKEKSGVLPLYFDRHPFDYNPEENINNMVDTLKCSTRPIQETGFTFKDLQNSLP